ncbi:MAG: AarF/UbiB family protein [Bdellovibrionales bacterium]|nr:AarF/UbiB family protein [Bdellovibrionales bacterium]
MLVRLVISIVILLQTAVLFAEHSEKEIIEYVEREVGTVIDRNESSEAYRVFEELFEKLSKAQSSMVADSSVSMNRFYLLSTPMVNAFVIPQKDVGKNRIYNRVFITTGLIRHMMNFNQFDFNNKNYLHDPELQKEIKYGILRIIGIIAHELAHPLDHVQHDKISIHDHYKKQASQAIEIRADLEGAIITEKAGFSVEAVYLGLSRLFGKDKAGGVLDAVETAFSTHPSSHVRLSSQKMYLTLNRYETGLKTTDTPIDIKDISLDEFVTQVYNFRDFYKKFDYHPPKTLEEAVKRLEYSFYKSMEPTVQLEINRLILSIDQMLYETKKPTREYVYRFFKILKELSLEENRSKLKIYSARNLHFALTTKEMSEGINTKRPHSWYLKNSAIYNQERNYKTYLERLYEASSLSRYINEIQKYSTHFISDNKAYELLAKRVIPYLQNNKNLKEISELGNLSILDNNFNHKHKIMLDVYNEWFKGDLQMVIRQLLLSNLETTGLLPLTYGKKQSHYTYYQQQIMRAKAGDRAAKKIVSSYQNVFQDFVDNAKFWVAFELVSQSFVVDWRYIARNLNMNEDVLLSRVHNLGHQLIRDHVKYKRKSELYKTLSSLKKVINNSKTLKERFSIHTGTESVQWMNKSTLKLLKANANTFELFKDDFFKPLIYTLVFGSEKIPLKQEFIQLYKETFKEHFQKSNYDPYKLHRKVYGEIFSNKLSQINLETGSLALAQFDAMKELDLPNRFVSIWLFKFFLMDRYHQTSELKYHVENELTDREKEDKGSEKYLKHYRETVIRSYFGTHDTDKWFKTFNDEMFEKTVKLLFDYKMVDSYYSLISELKSRLIESSSYFQFVVRVYKPLIEEINKNSNQSKISILEWARVISPSGYLGANFDKSSNGNSYQFRELKKAILEKATKSPMDLRSNYKMFLLLTQTGATIESDSFFKAHLHEHLSLSQLERSLENERIHSRDMVFEIAQKILLPRLDGIVKSKSNETFMNAKVHDFLFKLNNLTKADSFAKDKLLEDMAWRLQLEGVRLSNFIEDEKTYNWRKANPSLVNLSSLMAELISGMDINTRYDFIEFLRDPDTKPELLDKITNQIYKSSYSTFVAEAKADPNKVHPKIKEKAYKFAQQSRSQIESYVYNSSASERMPVYELILSAGKNSIDKSEAYPLSFIRKSLNFEKSSNDERMLLTFLEMIPEHERTVSLSYLLSQSGEDKSDVKQLFKVFQSVGIKFGQLASIWNIFDEEINRQIRQLKDDAGAMDKHQVIEAVRSYLPKREFEKIVAWKQVLGSASIKTVVEVELVDGTKLALLVQNPNAKVQIESNITLSERFIEGLKAKGVASSSALFEGLVAALKEQIFDEIKFDLEAEMIKKARTAYMNVSKTMDLKGWKFHVPQVSDQIHNSDKIMALELVKGVTFDQLPQELKPEVGRLIAESSLNMLFMHGIFDPDRHKGNQLIDVQNKVIFPIDFGQMQEFSKTKMFSYDDRLVLARFIEGVSKNKVSLMIEMAQKMSDSKAQLDKKSLSIDLRKVLESHHKVSDKVTEIVESFSAHGLKFNKKFMFGGLKGLIILAGENYVSEKEFKDIVEKQVTKLYIQKWPLVMDVISSSIAEKFRSLFKSEKPKTSKLVTTKRMMEITHQQLSEAKKRARAPKQTLSCKSLF